MLYRFSIDELIYNLWSRSEAIEAITIYYFFRIFNHEKELNICGTLATEELLILVLHNRWNGLRLILAPVYITCPNINLEAVIDCPKGLNDDRMALPEKSDLYQLQSIWSVFSQNIANSLLHTLTDACSSVRGFEHYWMEGVQLIVKIIEQNNFM